MADDAYYNIVRFVPDDGGDGGGAALLLESPWRFKAGLKPDVNTAVCSYQAYANLGGQLGVTGAVQFCFGDDADPDLSLEKVLLLDAEPIEYGTPAGGGGAQAVKSRLTFVDDRYNFVEPRGGRLNHGLLNPSTAIPPDPGRSQPPQTQTMTDLLNFCLAAMGHDEVEVPDGVDEIDPPQDLKWFGTHAPTELGRLLAMADCVFALQPDATYEVYKRGTGTDPTIPDGRALPAVSLGGADGRGKTVVFTSFPTQVAVVLTEADLDPGDWRFVARNSDNAWVPIDSSGAYGSGTAITEVNAHFPNTPDPTAQEAAFRYIQLNPDVYDPIISPLLRKTWADAPTSDSSGGDDGGVGFEDGASGGGTDPSDGTPTPDDPAAGTVANGLPPQIDIDLRAMIATQNASSGAWQMPANPVKVPVVGLYDGNVLKVALRLVKLNSGVSSTGDLDGNCAPIDLDPSGSGDESGGDGGGDLQIRFSVGDAEWDTGQELWKPGYFYVGFSGGGQAGDTTTLSGQDAEQAMGQPDTIVVPIAELVAVVYGAGGGDPINAEALTDKCRALAARYLKDASTPPRVLAAAGFVDFTFDGTLTEVEIDQRAVLTRFRMDSWFRPAGSYLASEFQRLRRHEQSHPHESKTQGGRAAIGASGSAAPVQPMDHYAVGGSGTSLPPGQARQVLQKDDNLNNVFGWLQTP